MKLVILIVYTTRYRKGGEQFQHVAWTMALEKNDQSTSEVICRSVESKAALKTILQELRSAGKSIAEFHFIGHSGMYGPMFGTVDYPEQFSPYELKQLEISFTHDAEAYFHCCRSARWFAPYFARVQSVKTFGYHWYTTFSARKDKYKYPSFNDDEQPLYCFGCPGKKSHGLLASAKKFAGLMKAEPLKEFLPIDEEIDTTYNEVAELYANTFRDIKVRRDEFHWLIKHLPTSKDIKVLDIGCGNGALLRELSSTIKNGIGVDVSDNLLTHAQKSNQHLDNLSFQKINGPKLPFDDDTFDVVISLLSFRYLDWDPMMEEIERVAKADAKLIVIDMVTAPVTITETPKLLWSKLKHYIDRYRNRRFYNDLKKLVSHKGWAHMLKYNPIRSQHEMKWYLESRFPGRSVEVINVGLHSRIIAFDSGEIKQLANINLSYP